MTALEKYQRLECTGLWRETADEQRREVVVSFGDATVVLSDFAGRPLAHWSMPAIVRTADGDHGAVYRPGAETSETLEIADGEMVRALDQVRATISKRAPKPGRLRFWLWGGVASFAVVTGIFWLPNAVYRYASGVLPPVKQSEMGEQLALRIGQTHGGFCSNPEGQAALTILARRLLDDDTARGLVVPNLLRHPVILPGNIVIFGRNHIEPLALPEALAGQFLNAQLAGLGDAGIQHHLKAAGMWPTLTFLARGQLNPAALNTIAATAVDTPLANVPRQSLQNAFAAHEISATPFANTLEPSVFQSWLIDNDPYPAGSPTAVLPDGAWLGLKEICVDF